VRDAKEVHSTALPHVCAARSAEMTRYIYSSVSINVTLLLRSAMSLQTWCLCCIVESMKMQNIFVSQLSDSDEIQTAPPLRPLPVLGGWWGPSR
jgi:hypothetical protein